MTPEPAAFVCFESSQDRLGLSSCPLLIDNMERRVVYTQELLNVLTGEEDAIGSSRISGGGGREEEEAYFCTHATAEPVICWGQTGELPISAFICSICVQALTPPHTHTHAPGATLAPLLPSPVRMLPPDLSRHTFNPHLIAPALWSLRGFIT